MSGSEWSADDLVAALLAPVEPPFAGEIVVVSSPTTPATTPSDIALAAHRLATLPTVIVGAPGCAGGHVATLVDVMASDDDDLSVILDSVGRRPLAAQSLALLLRGIEWRDVGAGLVAESAVFSTLQGGPEHRAWLAGRDRRPRPADVERRVAVARNGATVSVTLSRPGARNALDVRMRDELHEALAVVEVDPSLRLELRGEGPAFCAGGDLDDFGTAPDAATAHLVRLRRSIGASLHRIESRSTAYVHGACAGSGVELAAFCGRVVVHPDATFVLPELELGLVPGAGGTVSLPRRIGRHRTAWLAFSGSTIDANLARSWKLVDEICLF